MSSKAEKNDKIEGSNAIEILQAVLEFPMILASGMVWQMFDSVTLGILTYIALQLVFSVFGCIKERRTLSACDNRALAQRGK